MIRRWTHEENLVLSQVIDELNNLFGERWTSRKGAHVARKQFRDILVYRSDNSVRKRIQKLREFITPTEIRAISRTMTTIINENYNLSTIRKISIGSKNQNV